MLSPLLTTGVLLGFDSFLVCVALGALPASAARRYRLPLTFALCDGLASLIGGIVGVNRLCSPLPWSKWLGASAVAGYGFYVLYLAGCCRGLTTTPAARWLVFSLPICLSLDNLMAGLRTDAAGAPAALVAVTFGALSGALAMLGARVGSALDSRRWLTPGWLGGCLLMLVAASFHLKEALS